MAQLIAMVAVMVRLLILLVAAPAWAQAISGSFNASFVDFNVHGVASTRLELNLSCSLVCPPTKPELHFRVAGACSASFAEAPLESVGYVRSGFGSDPGGVNAYDSEQFPAGSAFVVTAKAVSCHCGNTIGEGGYIDLSTPVTAIPPFVMVDSSKPRVGYELAQPLAARPKGNETVVVEFSGAGTDTTVTLGPSDFGDSGAGVARVTPKTTGTMTVKATLMPYGASHTGTLTVEPGEGGGGGGTGGGEAGGGEAGGGAEEDDDLQLACAVVPGLWLPVALAVLLRRRRRRARAR